MRHAARAKAAPPRTVSAAYLKRYRTYGTEPKEGDWPDGGLSLCIIEKNAEDVRIGGNELPSNVLYLVPYSLAEGASKEIAALIMRLESSSVGCGSLIPPRWVALDETLRSVWEFWNGLRKDYDDAERAYECVSPLADAWVSESAAADAPVETSGRVAQREAAPTVDEETAAGVLKLLSGAGGGVGCPPTSPNPQSSLLPGTARTSKYRPRKTRRTITFTSYDPHRKRGAPREHRK